MDYKNFFVTLSKQFPRISKIVLFGSRARGDFNEKSDFEIAVYGGLDFQDKLRIRDKIEEWSFVYKVDLVFMDELTDSGMLSNIEKDGIVIVSKAQMEIVYYIDALERLNVALAVEDYNDITQDAIIRRFEVALAMACKTMKFVLLDEGVTYNELTTPKQVVRSAFQADLISEGEVWFAMLDARNSASHAYSSFKSELIADEVRERFIIELNELKRKLEK